MRLDDKDLRVEAIFGPIIFKVPYKEAEEHGMVVPLEVRWSNVIMDMDPCEGESDYDRERMGVWQNGYRNDLIAKDAKRYDDDTQVLITCKTIEHAMFLRQRLPDFQLVYRPGGIKAEDVDWYRKHELMGDDEDVMNDDDFEKATVLFEKGKLKKAICTTVWNVGVDFQRSYLWDE
jgi:hypothetical protein